MRQIRAAGTALALAVLLQPGAAGQPPAALAALVSRPVPLRDGIGRAHEKVTTSSQRAQAYYDQGLACLHAFSWIEAARSFNEALRADANLALAHVGLSYALAELGDAKGARAAASRAQALASRVTVRERARIEIRALQLDASDRPGDEARRTAYRRRLDAAAAAHPDDVEVLLLVGRAQGSSADGHGMHAGAAAIDFYRRALAIAPGYFATSHYLTHAYENAGRHDLALEHAAAFARLAPAVPHALHMHGHVLRRVGRMPDAIDLFRKADALGAQYVKEERIPPALDWHYRHNLDLLGTSLQYLGQLRGAEDALKRSFEIGMTGVPAAALRLDDELTRREWPRFLLSRGRAEEARAAAAALAAHPLPLVRALADIVASRSLSALRRPEEAAEAGNRALRQMREAGPAGGILVPELQLAQGEHLLRSGQTDAARAMLREAAAKLGAQSGPDAWVQTLLTLESVARLARERSDWVLAAEMAEAMRRQDPEYPGTWYAQALVAEERGQRDAARDGYREAVRRWASADAGFPELAEARRRLAALGGRP